MALSDRSLSHHVRFARTLALLSGLGAGTAGCYGAHPNVADTGPVDAARSDSAFAEDGAFPEDSAYPDSSAVADAGVDANLTCEDCTCSWGSPPPGGSCEELGLWTCCAAVGPLAPPDLAA